MRAFKFTPLLKSMIWGGNRIASYKGIAVDRSDIGESWELSGVKGDESVVAEGEYAGMTLPELIGQLKGELVGHAVYERHGTEFPLLVKFIDARQDLSIQVHPNDVLAPGGGGEKRQKGPYGLARTARRRCGMSWRRIGGRI